MLGLVAFLTLLLVLCKSARTSGIDEQKTNLQGKLIFTHVIYRHGDRTPVDPYPTDPYRDPKYWPTGFGQLTNIGKVQHYELGKWLKQRYNSLLSETYSYKDIYVRSTDVDRTMMSAESNLAGMFEPIEPNEIWNKKIDWQPIPVHTIPENMDVILANKKPCPAYNYAMSKLLHTDYFLQLDKQFQSLFNYLTNMTGRKIDTIGTAQRLYDTFYIEEKYNLTLPDWTKEVYPSEELSFIARLSFQVDTYTPILARLKAGPLLKEILERFQDKFNNNLDPNRSVWIYSAHDTTVANLLNILGVFEPHTPPYTACIMLEMRLFEDIPYISVFYKNTTAGPHILNIPNCGMSCSLENMLKLYENVLPVDWERECRISMLSMTYEEVNITPAMVIMTCGSLFTVVMILLYFGVIYYKRMKYFDYQWYNRVDS